MMAQVYFLLEFHRVLESWKLAFYLQNQFGLDSVYCSKFSALLNLLLKTYKYILEVLQCIPDLFLKCISSRWADHRRRNICTGEKAKVVAAGWGTELIQFRAARQI